MSFKSVAIDGPAPPGWWRFGKRPRKPCAAGWPRLRPPPPGTSSAQPADFDAILRDIRDRDWQDEHRPIAPLRQAADAVLLDSRASFRWKSSRKARTSGMVEIWEAAPETLCRRTGPGKGEDGPVREETAVKPEKSAKESPEQRPGSTTVPMSRPSITTLPSRASFRWKSSRKARTSGMVEICPAAGGGRRPAGHHRLRFGAEREPPAGPGKGEDGPVREETAVKPEKSAKGKSSHRRRAAPPCRCPGHPSPHCPPGPASAGSPALKALWEKADPGDPAQVAPLLEGLELHMGSASPGP